MVTETFIKAVERFLMPCETDFLCITQPALKHSKLEYIPQTVLFTDPVVSLGCKTIKIHEVTTTAEKQDSL